MRQQIPKPADYQNIHYEACLKMDAGLPLSVEEHAACFHQYAEAAIEEEGYPPHRHQYEEYRDYHAKKYAEKLQKRLITK